MIEHTDSSLPRAVHRPHTIRLAGPWELYRLTDSVSADWPLSDSADVLSPSSEGRPDSSEWFEPPQVRTPPEHASESDPHKTSRSGASESHALDPQALPVPFFRVTIPDAWSNHLGSAFHGLARYLRRFGCPTNLEPGQRVELVIESLELPAQIRLNDRLLYASRSPDPVWRVDITEQLAPRNRLMIDLAYPAGDAEDNRQPTPTPCGLRASIRLEIWDA